MKLRQLFSINLVIAILIGGTCTFLAGPLLRIYGIVPDDASIWVTRLVGGSILGFATLMAYGRRVEVVQTRRAIALALLVQDVIGLGASLIFQFTGKVNFLGWPLNILTYGILAAGYAYFYILRPGDC